MNLRPHLVTDTLPVSQSILASEAPVLLGPQPRLSAAVSVGVGPIPVFSFSSRIKVILGF